MRNLTTMFVFPLAICFCCACSSTKNTNQSGKKKVTTLSPRTSTPGRGIVNAAGDGLTPGINAATTNGAGSRVNAENIANNAISKANAVAIIAKQKNDSVSVADFITKVDGGEKLSLNMSQLALQKASNAKIKAFADMIVSDHEKFQGELAQLAATNKLQLSDASAAQPDKELKSATAAQFEFSFVQTMIAEKQKAVRMFLVASKSKNTSVSTFAGKYLPVAKKQLAEAQELTRVVSPK